MIMGIFDSIMKAFKKEDTVTLYYIVSPNRKVLATFSGREEAMKYRSEQSTLGNIKSNARIRIGKFKDGLYVGKA
jgi:hypothetical protein